MGAARSEQTNSIIAHTAQESTDDKSIERGRNLFAEHAVEFRHERGAWLVPSQNGIGFYEVRLSPSEFRECADYEHRGGRCKHIHAASIAQAKSGTCSCCGHRVLNRFLSEVEESDNLLSWFVGDLLCSDCLKAGYWS